MPEYFVREVNGLIQGQVQSNTATDAAMNLYKVLVTDLAYAHYIIAVEHNEWIVFEVSSEDFIVKVGIQHNEDETLHFPDNELEPVPTPLALTLRKNYDGRPRKTTK